MTPPRVKTVGNLDPEDPYIARIQRSGCFPEHEALQDCYLDKKDWRACREEMARFKACFASTVPAPAPQANDENP